MLLINLLLITVLFIFGVVVWNVIGWPKLRSASRSWGGKVSVLIPARNEEANLPACLAAVLKQGGAVVEVLVYDDHSTDGTARVIGEYARLDDRVRAIEPVPLPPGWCGKNFACHQLAKAAKGEWLLFIDADARLLDGAVERMVEEVNLRRLKFLSCWPGLEMIGFWERALMPMLNFVVFSLFPAPLSLVRQDPSLGLAHGACLMIECESYFAIGGHAAVHDQIFEDVRLAQLWRASGARGLCLDGQDVVRVRMYGSLGEIGRGFQKNFFPAFRHEISFWAFTAFHLLVFLLPFLLLLARPGWQAAFAVGLIVLTRVALALRFRHPIWPALLHPVAEAILIFIGLSSWRRCKSGRGVEWRGRRYHQTG
jgi:chlorobactene glucosyltransferase